MVIPGLQIRVGRSVHKSHVYEVDASVEVSHNGG